MTVKNTSRPYLAAFAAAIMVAGGTPALAGPSETAFLERLTGIYEGTGQITGGQNGTVSCRLAIRPVQGRMQFTGRCTYSGGTAAQSFTGIIRYNDEARVYETSSQGHTVAGKKNGSTLVFVVSGNDSRGRGTSTMSFAPGSIKVQFEFVDVRSGKPSTGSIPFKRTS